MGLDISHYIPTLNASNEDSEFFYLEELRDDYILKHQNFITDYFLDSEKFKGIWFKEIGYQRKGMMYEFRVNYNCEIVYYDLLSVKKAYNYISGNDITQTEYLQRNFQKNFIDTFVEGESIFTMSW